MMRIWEYYKDYNTVFSNAYNYPDFFTEANKTLLDDILSYDFGDRKIRRGVERMGELRETDLDSVVKNLIYLLTKRNEYKYATLAATLNLDYNPIENYNRTEIMTDDETVTDYGKIDTLQKAKNTTQTRTPNLTETHTPNNLTSTETDQIEGFNSGSFQDANKRTTVMSGSETTTNTGTEGVQTTGTDTDTDTLSGSDTTTRNYTLNVSGNIGVTTSQQMIEQERRIAEFSLLNIIAEDIAQELTTGVF